jgi:ornithine cyclodeaminase/alanine dehydrogenase-like protein (mu-crystallin family)
MVLVLSRENLTGWLTMDKSIELVEKFYKSFRHDNYVMPPREMMQIPELDAVYVFMPSYSNTLGSLTLKLITEYRQNPSLYGLNVASGLILVFNLSTGQLEGLMDSVYPTAMRTGAIGGVAAKYMARRNSEEVGLLGSGNQAWTQLQAIKTVLPIKRVRVYSPNKKHREDLAFRAARDLEIEAKAVDSPRESVENADILVTATNSVKPVISGSWLSEGVHINSLGALATRRELDARTFQRCSLVVADYKESVVREAGDIIDALSTGILKMDEILELHEVVKGLRKGRNDSDEITLMKSVGFASLDLYFATNLYRTAREKGLGAEIDIA